MNDEFYMKLALDMALATHGQTGINPMVGCVIVKEGRIVGMGAHLRMGSAHAEINSLQMAGCEAEGSTVYVTLEPCSYHGRTPPCSDRLIHEKVKRVVVAAADPNPKVAGSGITRLRAAGVDVTTGILETEAARMNEKFNKYILTRMPFVTLKTASTLDGKIASRTGDSRWITGEASRSYGHTLRHQHRGIMVGIGTILADNPTLTTRLPVDGIQPVKIVVDSALRIPIDAKVFQQGAPVIILTTASVSAEKRGLLEAQDAVVIEAGDGPRVDLEEAMRQLGEREIGSILLEGGAVLNGAMLEGRLVDKCHLFFAPKLIGGIDAPTTFHWNGRERMADAVTLERMQVQLFGDDVCITGYPKWEEAEPYVHRDH